MTEKAKRFKNVIVITDTGYAILPELFIQCPECGFVGTKMVELQDDEFPLQCPKCGFRGSMDKAIYEVSESPTMSFGQVLETMKADPSRMFARKGWNGKHMHIYLTPGKTVDAKDWNDPEDLTGDEEEFGVVKILPHIDMHSADGSRVIGWLASQTDMLSDDWYEVKR